MPLDQDIVREMWVGNLKASATARNRQSNIDAAPTFCEPHARSASELVLELTVPGSPAGSDRNDPGDNGANVIELVPQALLPIPHYVENTVSPNTYYFSASDLPLPLLIPPSLYHPEPPVPKLAYSRPSRDWPRSPLRLQTPPHSHSLETDEHPLFSFNKRDTMLAKVGIDQKNLIKEIRHIAHWCGTGRGVFEIFLASAGCRRIIGEMS
ncbi:uncharacterized protein F5891DRAFT_1207705 [Suillus fuscotomentosus]|uniref:Uncharacterized protein n=1 Tax=Suillus fuscotomentosus TaxID=1912939 RepID=A0AAD4DSW9_9AGAM|nr:uncharacterized protein F5891DRAFT_1207705 [Suillus fuscotomentosus]KAG1893335.1 hypothetical protein F5891DRAFT_1207705 [Suillus fuscotomentosus]